MIKGPCISRSSTIVVGERKRPSFRKADGYSLLGLFPKSSSPARVGTSFAISPCLDRAKKVLELKLKTTSQQTPSDALKSTATNTAALFTHHNETPTQSHQPNAQPDYQTARKYWNKLKERLKREGAEPVTNCHRLKMRAQDGKQRITDTANAETLLRLVQSIPSPKAEPIKLWLAKVGYERMQEMVDPARSLNRASWFQSDRNNMSYTLTFTVVDWW